MRKVTEDYFSPSLSSAEWYYAGVVHFERNRCKAPVCGDCETFTIHPVGELAAKLSTVEDKLQKERPTCSPKHEEYKQLVSSLCFTVLAQPLATYCRITEEVGVKLEGVKGKKGDKQCACPAIRGKGW